MRYKCYSTSFKLPQAVSGKSLSNLKLSELRSSNSPFGNCPVVRLQRVTLSAKYILISAASLVNSNTVG